jgi:hypothetical protein
MTGRRFGERARAILWPSFLMAGVLEMLVFALVDPAQLRWFGGDPVEMSPTALYSLTYFVFWAVISTSGALTQLLEMTPEELNRREGASPYQGSRGWPR